MKATTPFLTSQVVLVGAALINLAVSTSAALTEEPKIQQLPLIPHHHARRRLVEESRRDSKSDIEVASLYQGYGTHYVDVWVGTPAQRQTLIIDTGSGITAFPCRQCDQGTCGQGAHIDDYFDETLSTSYHKVRCSQCEAGSCAGGECKVGMSYTEGSSWTAFEATDVVYMGGPHDQALTSDNGGSSDLDPKHAFGFSFPLTFACQTKLTGLFKTQLADGIMGMYDEQGAFWNQMRAANAISENKFSLCFTRQPVADKKGTESGALTMGGTDDRLHNTPMVYATRTAASAHKGFYNVHVRKIYLRHASGGDSSQSADNSAQIVDLNVSEDKLNAGNVIVDSGSTDTNFSPAIARQLQKSFQELSGHVYSHSAVTLTEAELLELPTILIQLAGDDETNMGLYPTTPNEVRGLAGGDMDPDHPYDVLLAVPPSHYMEYNPVKKTYVNRFYADSTSGSVIGANAMMGHDVFFDLDNHRIGWAESTCDYHELVSNGGFVDANKEQSTPGMPAAPSASQERIFISHPAIDSCSDLICRGTVVGCLLGFFIIGMCIGNACRRAAAEKAKVGYKRVVRCPDALEEDLLDTEAPEGAEDTATERVQLVPVEPY